MHGEARHDRVAGENVGEDAEMGRFDMLAGLLDASQIADLQRVQEGLLRDPTCLDRREDVSVPSWYGQEERGEVGNA